MRRQYLIMAEAMYRALADIRLEKAPCWHFFWNLCDLEYVQTALEAEIEIQDWHDVVHLDA